MAAAHQVELTIHAAAAVELVNDPLEAHLAWDGAAPKPLLVYAFLLDPAAAGRPAKDCALVTLGATPQVSADQGHLVLATNDATVEDVEGSAAVKAGLFFGGVSRRSFEHVESIAAQTDFELGQQPSRPAAGREPRGRPLRARSL